MLPAAPGLAGVCVCVGAVLHSYCIALQYPSTAIAGFVSHIACRNPTSVGLCGAPRESASLDDDPAQPLARLSEVAGEHL